jgi:hypothetical protein
VNTRGGLDVAILYGCWRQGLPVPEAVSEVCTALSTSFMELHRGYRIHQLLTEVIGEEQRQQFEANAWRVVKIFNTGEGIPRGRAVVTRNDALAVTASLVNGLFHYRKSVLGLRVLQPHVVQPERMRDGIHTVLPGQFDRRLPQRLRQFRPLRLGTAKLIHLALQLQDGLGNRFTSAASSATECEHNRTG